MSQLTLELNLGLLQRYRTLRECVHHTALDYPRGMKALAAECDLSESELSRRLNPTDGDKRSCDVDLAVTIMEVTGDLRPLHWLIAKFIPSEQDRRQAAVDTLAQMLSMWYDLVRPEVVKREAVQAVTREIAAGLDGFSIYLGRR
ncbi:MAG: phage regulatory CII family protein [Candidatus Binatia bacterium]